MKSGKTHTEVDQLFSFTLRAERVQLSPRLRNSQQFIPGLRCRWCEVTLFHKTSLLLILLKYNMSKAVEI